MSRPADDSDDLSVSGWAVIYADADARQEAREALAPLVSLRREQAARRDERLFRELFAQRTRRGEGYVCRPLDDADMREVAIDQLPRHLLLVGHPERLSFAYQQQLATRRAVGRVYFRRRAGYELYARAVVAAERSVAAANGAVLFAPVHDDATEHLAKALSAVVGGSATDSAHPVLEPQPDSRPNLLMAVRAISPTVVVLAGHGACFPLDPDADEQGPQQRLQGAVVTAEWPGPGTPVAAQHCFEAAHVDQEHWRGRVVIQLSSFAAGTSQVDELRTRIGGARIDQARLSFVSAHAKSFLANGALAFIGPVDRCWHFAPGTGESADAAARDSLSRVVTAIFAGQRIGTSLDAVSTAGAEAGGALSAELDAVRLGKRRDDARIVGLYATVQAARSLILIGDPAVRACAPVSYAV